MGTQRLRSWDASTLHVITVGWAGLGPPLGPFRKGRTGGERGSFQAPRRKKTSIQSALSAGASPVLYAGDALQTHFWKECGFVHSGGGPLSF